MLKDIEIKGKKYGGEARNIHNLHCHDLCAVRLCISAHLDDLPQENLYAHTIVNNIVVTVIAGRCRCDLKQKQKQQQKKKRRATQLPATLTRMRRKFCGGAYKTTTSSAHTQ